MSSGLEGQALRAMANERAKELCKAVYKLGARDYFVAAGKSWMTFIVYND